MFLLINKSNSCIFARAILGSMKKEQHWSTLLDCPQSFLLSSCISLAQTQDSCCFLVTCIVTGPNWNIFQQNITSDLTRLCWGGYWETPVLTSLTWIQPYIGKMKGMSQGKQTNQPHRKRNNRFSCTGLKQRLNNGTKASFLVSWIPAPGQKALCII